jgi:hypothetical protein
MSVLPAELLRPPRLLLPPPRLPARWRIPALFNHLYHGASGHLLHNGAGHLVNACAAPSNCPTDCGSPCATTYHLTVSGLGGPGLSCCVAGLNGTFTLTRIGGSCQWSTGIMFQRGGCSFGWQVFCSLVDCNNTAGAMRWVVQLYGAINFVWAESVSSATCPPTGSYSICANPCSGGTGASVILSG